MGTTLAHIDDGDRSPACPTGLLVEPMPKLWFNVVAAGVPDQLDDLRHGLIGTELLVGVWETGSSESVRLSPSGSSEEEVNEGQTSSNATG